MVKRKQGPEFLRFVAPVVETLEELGGSGTAAEVTDEVIRRVGISEQELAETLSSDQSRVRNQVGWARFYLVKAGLIESQKRGVWALTGRGLEAKLDEQAVGRLFKSVQTQFKKAIDGTGPLPEVEEESPGTAVATADGAVQDGVEATDEGKGGDEEPYDASKAHIITKPMSVEQLVQRLRHEEIDLAPDFQRKPYLWSDDQQSRLIESMLIRIPLPVFYFDATDELKWVVVDGLQRLSTIQRFMVETNPDNRLKLQGLEYLRQHDGKTFDQLPRHLQRRIEEAEVTAHQIQPGTPIEVKYNIFKRINTGGLVLTPQEIRNAIFQKKDGANHVLRELANSSEFKEATDHAISDKRMLDCEFVLRFVAFSLTHYTKYTEPLDVFLNRHMQRLNDDETMLARDDLRRRFCRAMRAARQIFGDDAFRKRYAPSDPRKPINKALFEALSVALGNLEPNSIEKLVSKKGLLKKALMRVLNEDEEFETSITQGTGDVKRVHKRFSTTEQMIDRILTEPS